MMLQVIFGNFKFSNIAWPLNIFIATGSFAVVFFISLSKHNLLFRWLAGVPFSVTLIAALLIQTVIMGLISQTNSELSIEPGILDIIGFTRITSSWPFILIYYFTLIALFATIVNRLKNPHWSDYAFYLNHVGLLVLLFASGFGASDIKRYVMYVDKQAHLPEKMAYDENKQMQTLPLAITLNDFILEEYAPKLAIVNLGTGKAIPENAPQYFQLDSNQKQTQIDNWRVDVDTFYKDAIRKSETDYREIKTPGSCPAAKISVLNPETGLKANGWVSCGNDVQQDQPLDINDEFGVIMTRPEAKRYASDIDVITPSGNKTTAILEVNKPLKTGDWTIYQYGYDKAAGKSSTYSCLELVYDPWLNVVYLGMALCAMGSLCLFWIGNNNKRKVKNNAELG
jgi:cytochrome c biogenesis protein ResB